MTPLADLIPGKRRERVRVAADVILRKAAGPLSTTELVPLVADALGEPKAAHTVARVLVDLAPEHPAASQTGEPFVRFGRTMRRWEWRPMTKAKRESVKDIEDRRERQRAAETEDEWTVHPEFLEDDQ